MNAEVESGRVGRCWGSDEIERSIFGSGKSGRFVVEKGGAGTLPVGSCLDVTRSAPGGAQIDIVLAVFPVIGDGDQGNAAGGDSRWCRIGHAGTGRREELPERTAIGGSAL